jgi:hypothetical protein
MRKKYEVFYYECGETKRRSRIFRCELIAYLYKGYLEYLLKDFGIVKIVEL